MALDQIIIDNHYNQDELKMGKYNWTKMVTWLTIGAITILLWGSVLHWLLD
jgi:prepilin signal peptidase PulO-like enzyme (type II secretory pathway)